MVAMVAPSDSNQLSSSISVQDKGNRNKRKFHSEPPLGDSNTIPSSQIECLNYGFNSKMFPNNLLLEQKCVNNFCSLDKERLDAIISKHRLEIGGQGLFDLGCNQSREDVEVDEFQNAEWSEFTETQLEELVLSYFDTILKNAIKKISSSGYTEEVAMKAVMRSGICYGRKDTLSNIVDNTLAFLRSGQGIDYSKYHYFENLQELERYTLAEMVCLLRYLRPFFSTGDAMWCLLICDMNLSHACAMEYDPLISSGNSETVEAASVSNVLKLESKTNSCVRSMAKLNIPRSNSLNSLFDCPYRSQSENHNMVGIANLPAGKSYSSENENPISSINHLEESSVLTEGILATTHQSPEQVDKCEVGKKGHTFSSKRVSVLRQKSVHLERTSRAYGAKRALRTVKHSYMGGLIMDKKNKSISNSTAANLKNASVKLYGEVRVDASHADETPNLSINDEVACNLDFSLKTLNRATDPHISNAKLSFSLHSENSGVSESNCNVETRKLSFAGMSSDEIVGQCVPHGKKNEMLRNLVDGVRELQAQLQEWIDWGQQKVMQAAQRLRKDNAELKTLRQEKGELARLKKEKQSLEENMLKKLSEMENALCKANSQVECANATIHRLEVENAKLRNAMVIAKLRAAESALSCELVSRREKRTFKEFQSLESQRALFQEELVNEKRKMSHLQQQLVQAQELHNQLGVKWRHEEKAKDEALVWVNSLRNEREQFEAFAKSKEDSVRLNAEIYNQNHMDDIRRLEKEIAELRLKNDSSKIEALRWSLNGGNASRLMGGRDICAAKETNTYNLSKAADYWELGIKDVRRERECVMCLNEEMSVVFLPCGHQVVCADCNKLHEKQGMKNCPSCRTPIQRRICVYFADSFVTPGS